jgi:hypothetical protein
MEMQIKIETTETAAGPMHDLVLVQGGNTIRLGLVVDDAQQALRELSVWLEDNTMDVAELVNGEVHAEGVVPLIGKVRVRQQGGTYFAKVRLAKSATYKASCTAGADQAAQALAAKVQAARCATRVTLSVGTPGADTGPEFKGETHYLLTVWEGGAA